MIKMNLIFRSLGLALSLRSSSQLFSWAEEDNLSTSDWVLEPTSRPEQRTVHMAALFDMKLFDWGQELVNYTVQMINNKSDGWFDDLLSDGTTLEWSIADTQCDATEAAKSYWKLREENGGPPHVILGCRCSGASMAVASIASLEGVTQCSMGSISDKFGPETTPFFSRVVSPNETMALVSMMRYFNWTRIAVINTDTQFATDASNELHRLWEGGAHNGKIVKSATVSLKADGSVDTASALQALASIPADDPTINSRIIVLNAHIQHAYDILQIATKAGFQPDTIWVGPSSWIGRAPRGSDLDWLPENPGYIGISKYRNRDDSYRAFLNRFQGFQRRNGQVPWEELPDFAAEYLVDAIVALARGLSALPHEQRKNGTLVTKSLRLQEFAGVSGFVRFTESGDRDDPQFTILQMTKARGGQAAVFSEVGSMRTTVESVQLTQPGGLAALCWPDIGCSLVSSPSDRYPVPESVLPKLVAGLSVLAGIAVSSGLVVAYLYCRTTQQIDLVNKEIEKGEEAKKQLQMQINKRAELQSYPAEWDLNATEILVPVSIESDEYWNISDHLQSTLPEAHISQLWRIQNRPLYAYYAFHKDRFGMAGINPAERRVWHGTSMLEPSVIYNDSMDGWMMQFACRGMWGKGIYFADNASYSDNGYAFKPSEVELEDRQAAMEDERELLLASLIVGESAKLSSDRELCMPPVNAFTKRRYNTVVGHTRGSNVHIVYGKESIHPAPRVCVTSRAESVHLYNFKENGRAYPLYVVRYYKSAQPDSRRSQFESRASMELTRSKRQTDPSACHGKDTQVWGPDNEESAELGTRVEEAYMA